MKHLHVIFWLLLLSHHPHAIASNNPKPEPEKINTSMLGIQIDGNVNHWILLKGYPWLRQGSMIGPCHFRRVEMDQGPKYAIFLCRGKGEVKIKTGESLKAGNLLEQSTKSGFDCFSHYAERTTTMRSRMVTARS